MAVHLLDDSALADPVAALAALHQGPAVFFDSRLGAWLVVSDRAVREALVSIHLSARATPSFFSALDQKHRKRLRELDDHIDRWMVFSDGKRHELPRRAMHPLLSKRAVTDVAPDIERLVRTVSAAIPTGIVVDIVSKFAYPIARRLAARVLDIAGPDIGPLLSAGRDLIAFIATAQPDVARGEPALRGLHHLREYVGAGANRNDAFYRACLDAGLDERTSVAAFAQMLTGSVEPMAMTISGLAHLTGPLNSRSPSRDVVEEVLRLSTAFRLAPRWSTAPLTIAGADIPAGQRVLLLLHAANHDPLRHPNPTTVIPGGRRSHLAFGHGAHYCLGAQVTRTALPFVMDELRRRAFVASMGRRRPDFGMSAWDVLEGTFWRA